MIIHVGPKKKEQFKETIISKINSLRTMFIVVLLLLPCLVYFSFKINWFSSGSFSNQDITASVAKVITGDGTGTAFLISPTKLITAQHVIVFSGLSEGAYVELEFMKAPTSVGIRKAKVLFIPKEKNNDFAILEMQKEYAPLIIDIDLEIPSEDYKECRLYDHEMVLNLSRKYIKSLNNYLDVSKIDYKICIIKII